RSSSSPSQYFFSARKFASALKTISSLRNSEDRSCSTSEVSPLTFPSSSNLAALYGHFPELRSRDGRKTRMKRSALMVTIVPPVAIAYLVYEFAHPPWTPLRIAGLVLLIPGLILLTTARIQLGNS